MAGPDEQIVDIDVSAEMEASFLEYAYSVIYSRALPDARDGLKPVQRRIVYSMGQMGLRPDRSHVKSSRVVGEVMGKLHPHGDQPIYDALVRLAQPFSMRLPLVDGHGNFGSLDDGPAAQRYTEARMAPAALAMLADLDEDVVDMVPNYDNKLTQPEVLPAAIPHLLVNGAAGIAVGMATNMAPHNLVEVISAARHLLTHPKADLDELMRFVPGPDLPGGGKIVGLDGVRQAYETGKGAFRTRATTRIEKVTARRQGIVVTELPYQVGPERVIEKIKDAVASKRLQGVSAVTDLTDRKHGLRLVIEVRHGFNPDAVLEKLYKLTPLEENFSINNVALVDGQPRTLGLKEMLEVWVRHRRDVTRRRSEHRLQARRDRLHLIDGLLVAILDIDDVIQIIRTSEDAGEARTRLMTAFDLSETQAEYILELRLRRLTRFSRLELENEKSSLLAEIAELEDILGSEHALTALVSQEMAEAAAQHGTPRRTILLADAGAAAVSAAGVSASAAGGTSAGAKAPNGAAMEVEDVPCWALLSTTGLVARTADDAPLVRDGRRSAHDVVRSQVAASARADVGVVTGAGRMLRLSLLDMPVLAPTSEPPSLSGGSPVSELVALERGEEVIALVPLGEDVPLALGTASGVVKRVTPEPSPSKDAWDVISLKDGDAVVGAAPAADDAELVFVTDDAQLLRFSAAAVRPQGRAGGGIAGIKLTPRRRALFFAAVEAASAEVVTIAGASDALPGTKAGTAKVTPMSEYPAKGRATAGVRAHRFLKGEDALLNAWVGPAPSRATSSGGQAVDLPDAHGRRDGSGTPLAAPVHGIG